MENELEARVKSTDSVDNKQAGSKQYFVTGLTHIDLGWLYDSEHYAECQEIVAVRLLDCLDQVAEFTYVIEQIAQYRTLAKRRPDLIKRLRKYVEDGRVEIGGGMASALDTNGPNGEGYVRNHLLGRNWVKEYLGGQVYVGELIDTFGISAQTPQIHRQFKLDYLMANRLGGAIAEDVFVCRGIDGSEILVAGPQLHPGRKPGYVHFKFLSGYVEKLDQLFEEAASSETDGPQLVVVYDENERAPMIRSRYHVTKNDGVHGDKWQYASLLEFFKAIERSDIEWPCYGGDLNPEFTGCYGLRPFVRLRNRQIETKLIEAEKWAVLLGAEGWKQAIDDAWWDMAYIQSHDIYSGSFPHGRVRNEVVAYLDRAEKAGDALLCKVLGKSTSEADDASNMTVRVFNGLPWQRQDMVEIEIPQEWKGVQKVTCAGKSIAYEKTEAGIRFVVDVPGAGSRDYVLQQGNRDSETLEFNAAKNVVLENEFIRMELSEAKGLERITLKESGEDVAVNCGGLLVAQRDNGRFQVDAPVGCEVAAVSGTMELFACSSREVGQRCRLSGRFRNLVWAEAGNKLEWKIDFLLCPGKPRLDIEIEVDWVGEGSRVRLALPTTMETSKGLYEVPFGMIERQPHGMRDTCGGGEWPVHRFVAVEDGSKGIALVNKGTIGAEVMGGRILSTLLRAPRSGQHFLAQDESSSQHGRHMFGFSIVPYAGKLAKSAVLESAQELNTPLVGRLARDLKSAEESKMSLSPGTCVLSAVKAVEDAVDNELLVRFYESAGLESVVKLGMPGMAEAWESNLLEEKLDEIVVKSESVTVGVNPFEIKTIRVKKT